MNNYDKVDIDIAFKNDDYEGLHGITYLEAGDFFEDHN